MKKFNIVAIIGIGILTFYSIISVILNEQGLFFVIDFLLPLKSVEIANAIMGMFLLITLVSSNQSKLIKIMGTIIIVVLSGTVLYTGIQDKEDVKVINNEEYTVYITTQEYSNLTRSEVFVKRNVFLSEYVGNHSTITDFEFEYTFIGDTLEVKVGNSSYSYHTLSKQD